MAFDHTRTNFASALAFSISTSLACFAVSVAGQDTTQPTSVNPVLDFPDPFVLREGNLYYALATGAAGQHIQAATSSDLVSWRRMPDALPRLPVWAAGTARQIWAPSVLKRGDKYVLYYTVPDRSTGFQCISRAAAQRPEGPYSDTSTRPFICQTSSTEGFCGSIDPSPFVDSDGTAYLYWKSDENSAACRTAPRVWVQRLASDGMALEGAPAIVLTVDQAWESHIVEGPAMLLETGTYLLFYSANWYASASYAVGYAVCTTPVGPCAKVTTNSPWLKSEGSILGPGGQEFFRDATGRLYIAYHAWTAPSTNYERGGARSLHIEPVVFTGGVPMIARHTPAD